MTAKAALIVAITKSNFRSHASLADAHLANAIEALIDERIKQASTAHHGPTKEFKVSFDDIQESIAKMDSS